MSAADVAAVPTARSAGRLQTVIVIAVTAVVIGVAAILISGGGETDGVTQVDLGSGAAAAAPARGFRAARLLRGHLRRQAPSRSPTMPASRCG